MHNGRPFITLIVGTEYDEKGLIRTWDLATRRVLRQFQVSPWDLYGCLLSPDGTFLAFKVRHGQFALREAASGKLIRHVGQEIRGQDCPWVSLRLSPDGRNLAAIGPDRTPDGFVGMVRLWDIATGKEVGRIKGPWRGGVRPGCAAFSPDSRVLAVSGSDNAVHLYELLTGKERTRGRGLLGDVGRVASSPDGKLLATASLDGIRLWDTKGKELVRLSRSHEGGGALVFTRDSKRLVAADHSGKVQVWDVATGKELHHREGPEGNWWAVELSADGGVVVLGAASEKWLMAQEVATGKTRWQLDYRRESVSRLALSPQGQTAAVVVNRGVIHIWDLKAEKLRHLIPGNEPCSNGPCDAHLVFSADGKALVSHRSRDGVQLWEVATGRERLRLKDLPVGVSSIAIAPNGRLIACGGADGTVGLWETARGKRLTHCRGHRGSVNHLAFSADGRLLLSGSDDTTALLWDVSRMVLPHRAEK